MKRSSSRKRSSRSSISYTTSRAANAHAFAASKKAKPASSPASHSSRNASNQAGQLDYLQYALQSLSRLPRDQRYQYELGIAKTIKKDPNLASVKLRIGVVGREPQFLLEYLLSNQMTNNVKLLQIVYQAYPGALSHHGHQYLLHQACKNRLHPNIIQFLAQAWPDALRLRDASGNKPVQYAVCSQASHNGTSSSVLPRILKALLRPDSSRRLNRDGRGLDLLQQAIADADSVETCQSILQLYPKDTKVFRMGYENAVLKESMSEFRELVLRSLPLLKSLTCGPCHWETARVCTRLLQSVQQHRSLTEFRIHNLDMLQPCILKAVQQLVQQNSVLTKLHLDANPQPSSSASQEQRYQNEVLSALSQGLASNVALQALVLSKLRLAHNAFGKQDLTSFLGSAAAPRITMLVDVDVLSPMASVEETVASGRLDDDAPVDIAGSASTTNKNVNERSSRVQFLKLQKSGLSSPSYKSLLHNLLPNMPLLKRLELDIDIVTPRPSWRTPPGPYELDITSALVTIINRGMLEHLVVTGNVSQVDIKPICTLLQSNTSLRHYDVPTSTKEPEDQALLVPVLEEHNSTLEFAVDFCDWSPQTAIMGTARERIWYWTNLNKYGRRDVARNPNMQLNEFFRLLDKILHPDFLSTARRILSVASKEEFQFLFIYGILRESPGVWCHNFLLLLATFSRPPPSRGDRKPAAKGKAGRKGGT